MHPMLNTAIKAARKAGNILQQASNNLDVLTVERKQHNDYVSEVDRKAEAVIVTILLDAYPKHAVLAEEQGAIGNSEFTWIIDPLDGTTNYLHGFPQYAVSIALRHRDVITQAVVYDPCRNEMFTATRGAGAFLNDRRMRVSKVRDLADALIGCGLPYSDFSKLDADLATLAEVLRKTSGVRRAGAASLDLCSVAAGRLDGYWEFGLKPWDVAAGGLIVQESGGLITDRSGESDWLMSGDVVCGNPKVFASLLALLQGRAAAEARSPI